MPTLEVARGRGFQASLPHIAPAPQIDARGFVAAEMGRAAIGEGLQSFGSSMGKIQAEMSEAVNARRIAEARMATSEAQASIAAEIAQEQDPMKWEGIAQARIAEVQKNLFNKGDSPYARQVIEMHGREWGTHMAGQTKVSAISRQFDLTAQTLGVEHNQQIMAGDFAGAAITRQKATKYVGPGSLEGMRLKEIEAQKTGIDKAAAAMMTEGNIDGAVKLYEASPLYSKDEKTIAIDLAKKTFQHNQEVAKNKAQADFYSSIVLRKANGGMFTREEINIWTKEGKLDNMDGARLLDDTPAPTAQFNDLINKRVLTYKPEADPTGKEHEQIWREGVAMGMDQLQSQRLNANFRAVMEANKTEDGRVSNHLRSYGLDRINDLMKAGAFGKLEVDNTSHALGALGDTVKMKQFGLTDAQALQLSQVQGPERLAMFKEFAASRYKTVAGVRSSTINAEEYNKLTDWTKNLLERAANGKLTGPDPSGASDAAGRAAYAQEGFETWFTQFKKEKKRNPTDTEVQKAVNDLTRGDQNAPLWDAFEALPAANPTTTMSTDPKRYKIEEDGSFSGTASSYGYSGDDDNGFNSVGMRRGEQPWYGQHPTLALAPSTAESLGVRLPRKTKDGWDISGSLVEVEVGGKKVKAIYDENGMYVDPRSKDKLIDFTPELSAAFGVPIKQNVSGVKIRKAS